MDSPVFASADSENETKVAEPRDGRPVVVLVPKLQKHPDGGVVPGGVPPGGLVKVLPQVVLNPNCPALYTGTSSLSVCKRDLRDLAWVEARRSPRVTKVAFIVINLFQFR